MIDFSGKIHNHREKQLIVKYLTGLGFHIIDDLVPFYDMVNYFRRTANLSQQAKLRIKWFDYFYQCQNVSLTCRYFGISRKTFHKWQKIYDKHDLTTLEDRDRAPIRTRQPEITFIQEQRIIQLRKQHIRYGKEKLSLIYERTFNEPISAWKIYRVIKKYKLYHNPAKTIRIASKRQRAVKKKRITELRKKYNRPGYLICLDVIVVYWNGLKRYVFTAIDILSKIAFARMYSTRSSYNARDFLLRLNYLLDGNMENIQTDNGSEFEKYFRQACQKLNLERYYNRPRTPKDNAVNENFNGTLRREFLELGNFTPDLQKFNYNLTEWLVEYNFKRPHQTLDYQTPIEFTTKHLKVLPMYPTCARY